MSEREETEDTLCILTVREALDIVGPRMWIPRRLKDNKSRLVAYLRREASSELVSELEEAARRKQAFRDGSSARQVEGRREERAERRRRQWAGRQTGLGGSYLQVPGKERIEACYRQFYEATSNEAVAHGTCAVCARERHIRAEGLKEMELSRLPNREWLVPRVPHPAHTLFENLLLEPAGVSRSDGGALLVKVCNDCYRELDSGCRPRPPLSLGNNMWIGPVPPQLQDLTIPEQLLIALLYPRVYVFKLWPRSGYRPDPSALQRGLRGNVSTYEMDLEGVVDMVEGNLMPRRPAVLASVIAVTFIGSGRLPMEWLRATFRVRRERVAEALRWLRVNNAKYYGDITISDERLASLPEDDIPREILETVRQEQEEGVLEQESAGSPMVTRLMYQS